MKPASHAPHSQGTVATAVDVSLIEQLRALAVRGLQRMYRSDERLFVFRVRRTPTGVVSEGLSPRYTAITLIGLAGEDESVSATVLAGHSTRNVCERLLSDIEQMSNLGDVALTLWAARAIAHPAPPSAWERLLALCPIEGTYPTVELAWTLTALCIDEEAPVGDLRERIAHRLLTAFVPRAGMFPHLVGDKASGLRAHISCFADLVYPVQALAHYAKLTGNNEARDAALRCANQFCAQQGDSGQWWWHYHLQTGETVEPYPVYAVHQDAMAPMALFALEEASDADFTPYISKGLAWLARSPELDGGSLIDNDADLIWRKVARREPRKLARYLQTVTSRIHPSLRVPGLDLLFPVGTIDDEDRPYHLGWLLYAWPLARVARWKQQEESQ